MMENVVYGASGNHGVGHQRELKTGRLESGHHRLCLGVNLEKLSTGRDAANGEIDHLGIVNLDSHPVMHTVIRA